MCLAPASPLLPAMPGIILARRGHEEEAEGYVEAEAALEEMDDADEEEREVEETEDLLEYYLQRAAGTQSEAERLLAGARDLEESIGVSLSARRFEVGGSPRMHESKVQGSCHVGSCCGLPAVSAPTFKCIYVVWTCYLTNKGRACRWHRPMH